MHLNKFILPLALVLTPVCARAAIIVTYAEGPGEYNSTLQKTTAVTFDAIEPGFYSNIPTTVGTYDELRVNAADQYGGAGSSAGSNYVVQGANGPAATTLTLVGNVGYFGLWWSAGDNQNVLEFYNGELLVARFTTQSLLTAITAAGGYNGNPRTGENTGEPYAFVNFFGEGDTTWDSIVFTNSSGSGFESDNHTIRDLTWGGYTGEEGRPLPGVVVAKVSGSDVTVIPEPASALLLALGVLGMGRRRR